MFLDQVHLTEELDGACGTANPQEEQQERALVP